MPNCKDIGAQPILRQHKIVVNADSKVPSVAVPQSTEREESLPDNDLQIEEEDLNSAMEGIKLRSAAALGAPQVWKKKKI